MLKLTLCILCSLLVAVMVLHLRQQRLEINHEANQLHNDIEQQQAKLWSQQLRIAEYTAPNAIEQTVGHHDLNMIPRAVAPAQRANWVDTSEDIHA